MPIQVRLIVVGGKASKAEVALKLPSVIGRSRDAGLSIAHPMVSRRHCEVFEADGLLMIRDLGSLNGTLIAGQRIKESPLPPESEFTVGPLTFRTQYQCQRDLSQLPPPVLAEPDVAIAAPPAPIEPPATEFQVVEEPPPVDSLPVGSAAGQAEQDVSFFDEIIGEPAAAPAPDVSDLAKEARGRSGTEAGDDDATDGARSAADDHFSAHIGAGRAGEDRRRAGGGNGPRTNSETAETPVSGFDIDLRGAGGRGPSSETGG